MKNLSFVTLLAVLLPMLAMGSGYPGAYLTPHTDSEATVALWHMDAIDSDKYIRDDDSIVVDRNADLILSPNPVSTEGGPELVDPSVAGIPYPAGNSAFGNCIHLDGTNLGAVGNGSLSTLDPANVRVEAWCKADAAADNQVLIDRWGQFVLYPESTQVRVLAWDGTGAADNYTVSPAGWDPTVWNHVAVDFVADTLDIYVNGSLEGSFTLTDGLSTTTSKTASYVGQRYNSTSRYIGYIDEVKISEVPETPAPYVDETAMVSALWHFDELGDPEVHGKSYELMMDDDSANPGRDVDLMLFGDGVKIDVGVEGGPSIVDPVAEGIGYPAGNPAFGNCTYFDDEVMVEKDAYMIGSTALQFDPANVRFETWIRPDSGLADYIPDVNLPYYILDRWGQIIIRLYQMADTGRLDINVVLWGENQIAYNFTGTYSDSGTAPENWEWAHIVVQNFQGDARLYINGKLAARQILPTAGLSPTTTKGTMFIGQRYNTTGFYWGYMDEMRVSAVSAADCGMWGYLDGDLDMNCYVDLDDFSLLAEDWLYAIDASSGAYTSDALKQDFNAPMATVTPTIDGTFAPGEWSDAKVLPLSYPDLVAPGMPGSIAGTEAELTPEDISAVLYYKWDAEYLYFGYEITDDVFIAPSGGGYPDDHLLFAFNPDLANGNWENALVFELYVDGAGQAQTSIYQDAGGALVLTNSMFAGSIDGNNWKCEAAMKWTEIVGDSLFTPSLGDKGGVGHLICDNDQNDSTRDVFLLSIGQGGSGAMTDPSMYHTVTLTDGLVCGDNGYPENDITGDCIVNLEDYSSIAAGWLECTDPLGEGCIDVR
jgi:hypothetical protein